MVSLFIKDNHETFFIESSEGGESLDFLLLAKSDYYSENDSSNILKKITSAISHNIISCRPEVLCILNDIVNTEPCCYWKKNVFETTEKNLQDIAEENQISIDEEIFELFLAGYHAYEQITNVINDLANVNDSPAMKNRQYRMPTYVSIVEGCLTNLYHFITLILNQTLEKDYSSTYKLNSLCEILNKNGFNVLTEAVNINIRNAINHGGIIFKEDGQKIDFHYTKERRSVTCSLKAYEFDHLINEVYDTASAILLGITVFLNDNWEIFHIDNTEKTFVSFSLLGMELSIPQIRCRYISEVTECNQLNAEFWISNTDRTYIIQTAIKLAMLIYSRYSDYDKYYISFSNERLATSWVRFSNQEIDDMINKKREISVVLAEVIAKKEVIIFEPSTELIDLQEIKYFRFPNYRGELYKINQIEEASLPDRKRLRCKMFIGDISSKEEIISIIKDGINWLKTVKNVDSPTIHHKNGEMEADALYINVYRYDTRKDKGLYPNNQNFVCFVDYNLSGETTLVNGGLPPQIWKQLYHEKIEKMFIAWREAKYTIRHVKKIGVNTPCPCGSGKKFKKCCKGKGIFD